MSVKQNGVPNDSRWKQIPEFQNYWVSQYGQVFNMKRLALMSLHYNQHHVLSVRMYGTLNHTGSRGYFRSVAKLVRRLHGQELQVSHARCSPWLGGWPMGVGRVTPANDPCREITYKTADASRDQQRATPGL